MEAKDIITAINSMAVEEKKALAHLVRVSGAGARAYRTLVYGAAPRKGVKSQETGANGGKYEK